MIYYLGTKLTSPIEYSHPEPPEQDKNTFINTAKKKFRRVDGRTYVPTTAGRKKSIVLIRRKELESAKRQGNQSKHIYSLLPSTESVGII